MKQASTVLSSSTEPPSRRSQYQDPVGTEDSGSAEPLPLQMLLVQSLAGKSWYLYDPFQYRVEVASESAYNRPSVFSSDSAKPFLEGARGNEQDSVRSAAASTTSAEHLGDPSISTDTRGGVAETLSDSAQIAHESDESNMDISSDETETLIAETPFSEGSLEGGLGGAPQPIKREIREQCSGMDISSDETEAMTPETSLKEASLECELGGTPRPVKREIQEECSDMDISFNEEEPLILGNLSCEDSLKGRLGKALRAIEQEIREGCSEPISRDVPSPLEEPTQRCNNARPESPDLRIFAVYSLADDSFYLHDPAAGDRSKRSDSIVTDDDSVAHSADVKRQEFEKHSGNCSNARLFSGVTSVSSEMRIVSVCSHADNSWYLFDPKTNSIVHDVSAATGSDPDERSADSERETSGNGSELSSDDGTHDPEDIYTDCSEIMSTTRATTNVPQESYSDISSDEVWLMETSSEDGSPGHNGVGEILPEGEPDIYADYKPPIVDDVRPSVGKKSWWVSQRFIE